MEEHRSRIRPQSTQAQPTAVRPKKKFGLGQLAQRYGVTDMMDFSSGDTSTENTVDDEFLAYTTANFNSVEIEDKDILTFWEVSALTPIVCASSKAIPNRKTKPSFQHCSASH